jgi:hypothetical protein
MRLAGAGAGVCRPPARWCRGAGGCCSAGAACGAPGPGLRVPVSGSTTHRACSCWYNVTPTRIQPRDRPSHIRQMAHQSGQWEGWGTSAVVVSRRNQEHSAASTHRHGKAPQVSPRPTVQPGMKLPSQSVLAFKVSFRSRARTAPPAAKARSRREGPAPHREQQRAAATNSEQHRAVRGRPGTSSILSDGRRSRAG